MDIVVCFALFLAAMLFCLVKDFSLAWALLFALVLFFACLLYTSLGLSIVKHAVAYHHGMIALKSEVGKGTEITVRFPQEK